jgi:rhodanese-related sulfurtransferase
MIPRNFFLGILLAAWVVVPQLVLAANISSMTADTLKALQQANTPVILINIGPRELFDRLHIQGAIHIPRGGIEKVTFPTEAKIVLYRTGFGSLGVREAAAALIAKGYQDVSILQGEAQTWKSAGIPLIGPGSSPVPNPALSAIPARQLLQAINDQEEFVLVDVRSPEAYLAGHVQGAINVSPRDVSTASTSWAKIKWIVVYDDGRGLAQSVMSSLHRAGFASVGYVRGGYQATVAETARP